MLRESGRGGATGDALDSRSSEALPLAGSSPAPGIPAGSKRCPECGETKPFSEYANRAKRQDRELGLFVPKAYCRPCENKKTAEWQGANRAKVNAAARRNYRRRMDDPEYRRAQQEYWRESKRLEARADPDYKARRAEASRRYRARLRADPERYAAHLEARRLAEKLRRERQGKRTRGGERDLPNSGTELPAAPLREWLERRAESPSEIAQLSGLSNRAVYRVRKVNKVVRLPTADAILTGLGAHLMDVYPDLYE